MFDNIETVKYIQIPLSVYEEIQSCLPNKLQAIKALRNSRANINNGKDKFYLKECKHIIDWIIANPGGLFINNKAVLVPVASVL